MNGLVQPCHFILAFKTPKRVLQLCLSDSESTPVVRYTQAIEKKLPENVFYLKKKNKRRRKCRCKRFSIFIPLRITPRALLGVYHQQVISVHDGLYRLPDQEWCDFWWVLGHLYCSCSPLAPHHQSLRTPAPPLHSSPLWWWQIQVARLIPAYWSSSLDHQPLWH